MQHLSSVAPDMTGEPGLDSGGRARCITPSLRLTGVGLGVEGALVVARYLPTLPHMVKLSLARTLLGSV